MTPSPSLLGSRQPGTSAPNSSTSRSITSTKPAAKMVLNHFTVKEQTTSHVCATPLSIFASSPFGHMRIKKTLSWKRFYKLVSEKPDKPTHVNQGEQVVEKKLIKSLQSPSETQSNLRTFEIQVNRTSAQHAPGRLQM